MPLLVRFLLRHALIGVAIAALFVGALVGFDVGGLGTLILHSPSGWLAAFLLVFGFGITFGSVQMGAAVMLLPGADSGPRGRRTCRTRDFHPELVPAKAVARR